MKNDPAFPELKTSKTDVGFSKTYYQSSGGLTKREYFASLIAAGKNGNPQEIAEHAVWVADALIKELERSEKGE